MRVVLLDRMSKAEMWRGTRLLFIGVVEEEGIVMGWEADVDVDVDARLIRCTADQGRPGLSRSSSTRKRIRAV